MGGGLFNEGAIRGFTVLECRHPEGLSPVFWFFTFLVDHLAHVHHHHHNISPEELSALECVLELITTLSEHVSLFSFLDTLLI